MVLRERFCLVLSCSFCNVLERLFVLWPSFCNVGMSFSWLFWICVHLDLLLANLLHLSQFKVSMLNCLCTCKWADWLIDCWIFIFSCWISFWHKKLLQIAGGLLMDFRICVKFATTKTWICLKICNNKNMDLFDDFCNNKMWICLMIFATIKCGFVSLFSQQKKHGFVWWFATTKHGFVNDL